MSRSRSQPTLCVIVLVEWRMGITQDESVSFPAHTLCYSTGGMENGHLSGLHDYIAIPHRLSVGTRL